MDQMVNKLREHGEIHVGGAFGFRSYDAEYLPRQLFVPIFLDGSLSIYRRENRLEVWRA